MVDMTRLLLKWLLPALALAQKCWELVSRTPCPHPLISFANKSRSSSIHGTYFSLFVFHQSLQGMIQYKVHIFAKTGFEIRIKLLLTGHSINLLSALTCQNYKITLGSLFNKLLQQNVLKDASVSTYLAVHVYNMRIFL